ncbi:IS30 family transposase [Geopsychrobacter electrodiphilus]|uniref:IS30 family transposase n=1 Tax=Geopsychrobacter electrodiphilus TaxID=225196 RepID=UPI00035CBCC8|nr:IS30 family transposase [Geopsychrobacter electrodiphilus]
MHYTQLTREERYQISALKTAGQSKAQMAKVLGRHKSTIGREMARNCGLRGYRPKQADGLAVSRRQEKVTCRITRESWARVEQLTREYWSPEQVSYWLRQEECLHVSPEWIYQYVLRDKRAGGDIYRYLRCQKQRKKRYGAPDRRGQLKGRVSIDERPEVVNERSRVGDWEADTVIGKQGSAVLVTLVERKTRWSMIGKAPDRTAKKVRAVIVKRLLPLASHVKTLTYDNGKEFALHLDIDEMLQSSGYFAHPYHSWERGLNENTNGLIRQFFPKGKDLAEVTDEEIQRVMNKLNNRPRKCLGFKTPNQVFFGINPPVALAN